MTETPTAVLFDRDGTLVEDVPYNGNPDLVRPVPSARDAVGLLRSRRVRVGVVTNQSGVARGLITTRQLRTVHARVEEMATAPALATDLLAAARLAASLLEAP